MAGAYARCSNCSYRIDPADLSADGTVHCRGCLRPLSMVLFPALWKPLTTALPEALVAAEEASCFYHQGNRATVACDGCGRFLCNLCDIEVQGQHLCPSCVESGVRKGKVAALDHSRVLYGKISFYLTIIPLLIWPLTCVTAPTAVFLAIWSWKRPGSLTGAGNSHAYHVFAIIFGLLEVAGWIAIIAAAASG